MQKSVELRHLISNALKKSAESGERSVLILGSFCLPCCGIQRKAKKNFEIQIVSVTHNYSLKMIKKRATKPNIEKYFLNYNSFDDSVNTLRISNLTISNSNRILFPYN